MWLIRSDEETNPEYGKSPRDRSTQELVNSSVIIVDKHPGPTSHQVTAWVREIFNAKLSGHCGTLDPAVTGILPVALENATKAMPILSGLSKEYVGVMHLHKEINEDFLRKMIVDKFIGKIKQIPPKKSAVARKQREREIYFFDVLEIEDRDVLFKVGCEAGTYIRKLVSDLGMALKVGAHMSELRRTKVGTFEEDKSYSVVEVKDAHELWKNNGKEDLLRKMLVPVDYAVPTVKKIFVKDSAIDSLCNGAPLYPNGITRVQKDIIRGETIVIMSLKEELIALGIAKMAADEMIKRKTGISVRVDRVLMEKGTYPKWDL